MKQAAIYMRDLLAGLLVEDENGYSFCYDHQYLNSESAEPVSLTLPLQEENYYSNVLFPFFDGLIPEGWLLEMAGRSWKIDRRDRMSLLMTCCKDCIGAISVVPIEQDRHE